MKKQLEKTYDPKMEEAIYQNWLKKGYFKAKIDKTKKPFSIMMPPPNITGHLHMGHALNNTLQDIIIRFKRMQGYCALWLPGTDHASISTEVKVCEKLLKDGIKKEDIGREEFLKKAWQWREEYGKTIINQLKKLGNSCDFSRERFTLDEGLSKAVLQVFVNLYEKGYIYKGEKLINWCPCCKTTISDAEVNHVEKESFLWHIKYPIKGTADFLCFATTRPETMLGDTAIAVNPNDERYKSFIGKTCIVPFVNREIPIIADEYVDMEFGTGVVKVTPAHDPNDFEIGLRHNLPKINVLNDNATINENGGIFKNLSREDARKEIIENLKKLNLFVKKEPINHSVGTHERCNQIVEPLIKTQWFVKMDNLAKKALDAYYDKKVNFVPDRFAKIYIHWLENIKDWCISRQLWWGHRIPAYYCQNCGNIEVSINKPKACSKCACDNLLQDEDILDTWFSSALWCFSTLGWPEKTEELEYFYPTNVLVTGYDIIFFWVVRMVFSGLEQMEEVPFKDVLINGLVRDANGQKMSKSLGNGIDPLDVIEKYGADALRLMLIKDTAIGNDIRFHFEKLESNRNFLNKIWNAARFIFMHINDDIKIANLDKLIIADKWILSKCNTLIKEVTHNIENYDLGIALSKIYDFIWDEYCDWYIEMVKPRLYNQEDKTREAAIYTLKTVLINCLKMLHVFTPFITEELFTSIQDKEETIMLSSWPKFNSDLVFSKEEQNIEIIKNAIKNIRAIRTDMNVPNSKKAPVILVTNDTDLKNAFEESTSFFKILANATSFEIKDDILNKENDFISSVIQNGIIYIPFKELIDKERELLRLKKEEESFIKEIERVDKKLANSGFISKAPQNIIEEEKAKKYKYEDMLKKVKEQISILSNI